MLTYIDIFDLKKPHTLETTHIKGNMLKGLIWIIILNLFNKKAMKLGGKTETASILLEFLYSTPQMSVKQMAFFLKVSYVTANDLVKDLERLGLLRETTGHSRNRIYSLYEYLDLFRE